MLFRSWSSREARHPGRARGTQGKPGKGYPGLPGGTLALPWVPWPSLCAPSLKKKTENSKLYTDAENCSLFLEFFVPVYYFFRHFFFETCSLMIYHVGFYLLKGKPLGINSIVPSPPSIRTPIIGDYDSLLNHKPAYKMI